MSSKGRRWLAMVGVNILILVALLGLVEGWLAWRYANPGGKPWVVNAAREYYRGQEGRIIQYMDACGQFDPEVSYTLKPGGCRFRNREFDTIVEVNAAGLRDDALSLQQPEIIVLGDSHAMGWGVEQEETFPQLIERKGGQRVLNAAISSFGSVRQLRLLQRLDRSALQVLVIQYCPNDFAENQYFMQKGNVFKTMEEQGYLHQKHIMKSRVTPYYPGKYMRRFWPLLARCKGAYRAKSAADPATASPGRTATDEVRAFLNAVEHLGGDLSGVRVVVTLINRCNANQTSFLERLQAEVASGDAAPPIAGLNLSVVNVAPLLSDEDYFVHDDHMRASGHHIVADALLAVIEGE